MAAADKSKFMLEAISLSREHMQKNDGGPFGAVIVRNGEIVGCGWNCVVSSNDPTAHAEVSAIRDACRKLKTFTLAGCEIFSSCEPCPMCLGAILWARLDKMYIGNTRVDAAKINFDDEFFYQEISMPPEKRKLPVEQLCHEEANEVFQLWASKTDKVHY